MSKKGASGSHVAIDILMYIVLLMAVTYPIAKNVIANQSLTGVDYLVASASLTLIIVLIIVKIAKAMKSG